MTNTGKQPNFINPPTMSTPNGYTHVVETFGGRTIYVAGQIALNLDGQVVGLGDASLQAEQVFKNLEAALVAVGAGFDNVVKLTFYMIDMADFPAIRKVRDRFVNTSRPPASTALQIGALAADSFLLEIEAIAVLDS
ncbi:MAG TPA: RidA family protein [Terrimesophilobacter sp.]|nr:RidA family protein [Terrimesophilobacter sp.]